MTNVRRLELPTPFPVGSVNAYLITGDPLTLVDTGPRYPEALTALREGLRAHGVAFSDVERLVITHPHVDHYGLADRVVAESGAEVLTHPEAVTWLRHDPASAAERRAFYRELLLESGVPEPVSIAATIEDADQYGAPVRVDRVLHHDDAVRLGGVDWRVLHTPGHAGAHLCLYNGRSRALIAGDHLLPTISSNPLVEPPVAGQRRRSLVEYLRSLRLVAALDVAIVRPGHGTEFADHRSLVERRCGAHERRAEQIASIVGAGCLTVFEIVQRLFRQLVGIELFLGVSEVIGHLELLELRRLVGTELSGGLRRYRSVGTV